MGFLRSQKSVAAVMTVVLSFVLVASFGIHTVQVDHVHPGHHNSSGQHEAQDPAAVSDYLHGMEEKAFLLALFAFFALGIFIFTHFKLRHTFYCVMQWSRITQWCRMSSAVYVRFDYHRMLFRKGILNPKMH